MTNAKTLEIASSVVLMDQLVRGFTAVGGKILIKAAKARFWRRQALPADETTLVLEVGTLE